MIELKHAEFEKNKIYSNIQIIIIIATHKEKEIVFKYLKPLPNHNDILKYYHEGQVYYLGLMGLFPVCVVKTTMMGSANRDGSITTLSDTLGFWKNVKAVIMPGLAFGRCDKSQKIGDILVSETIASYEMAKEDEEIGTIHRGQIVPAGRVLLNRFTQDDNWRFDGVDYKVIKCQILSGEKLVDDKKVKTKLFDQFKDAKGGEMEGHGVFVASDINKTEWIVCKSICDWAVGKNDDGQDLAARTSISYVENILNNTDIFIALDIKSISDKNLQHDFFGQEPNYQKILGYDIVKIIFPRHEIKQNLVSISKERVYYEFFEVKLFKNNIVGYLFFAKNVIQDKVIKHFIENNEHNYNSLIVCSPRVRSEVTGQDNFRLKNIEKKLQSHGVENVEYEYIEDLVWQYSFNGNLANEYEDDKYFIDQKISSFLHTNKSIKEKSLDYFETIFFDSSKPLIAVLGSAGVGKTTLCNQLKKLIFKINKKGGIQKNAIYISSSDINLSDHTHDVNNITDLYNISQQGIKQHDQLIDSTNLEVNISCGNIIVIIDGLDEIEATLKDKFNFDEFIKYSINLKNSYNNSMIIVTCRDYYMDQYQNNDSIELLSLSGFDENLAERYFDRRFYNQTGNMKGKALKLLSNLEIIDGGYYAPVILALICDLIEIEDEIDNKDILNEYCKSKYLFINDFDLIVNRLIDREILRQTLTLSVDEVIEIFFEIARTSNGVIRKTDLDKVIELYYVKDEDRSHSSFYVNPLLRSVQKDPYIEFRYDHLLLILRSRYFIYHVTQDTHHPDNLRYALLKFYDGKGDLLIDILNHSKDISEEILFSAVKRLIRGFTNMLKGRNGKNLGSDRKKLDEDKKCISALLYLYFGSYQQNTKTDIAEKIKLLFSGHIQYMFIYGDFYPIDFSGLKIENSGFYDFNNFDKSFFPKNEIVFFDTEFTNINPKLQLKIEKEIFDKSCHINSKLKHAITKVEGNKKELIQFIKSDFIKLFKIFFSGENFGKVSENLFKGYNTRFYSKLTTNDYVTFFFEKGIFKKEKSNKTPIHFVYFVNQDHQHSIRYLLTNSSFDKELRNLFTIFLKRNFDI
jgi:nucleoside phosphorylase/GTPase SAR1 family protein